MRNLMRQVRSRFLLLFVLCGLVLSGGIAKADTVVPAVPESQTTEDDSKNDEGQTTETEDGWNSSKTCYYKDGQKVKGIQKIDNKLYYFNSKGNLYKKSGLRTISQKKYYFNKDGSLQTGVVKVKGKNYYFRKDTGERYEAKGIKKIDGKYYCFTTNYYLKSGWYRDSKKKRYYFDKETFQATTGWAYIGKFKYYFNSKGQLCQDVRKKLSKKEKDSYQIKVNRTASCVTVYAKDQKKGKYIIPVVSFVCSAGKGTPTGTFMIRDKLRWHELMGPCWGQWCEHLTIDILFHSVYYNEKGNNRSLDVSAYNKLGTMASHGCIRLTAGDAKWIYDNCKIGTKVTIYNNKKNPGPFDKPKAKKLRSSQTWDPTDPTL
ncbi:MAG: L,D-transpeptidase family protein [Lachnospiraceae bacterium]|nr:L,D-transpeptidase family protein [Lachnospiraceae bacterium]